MDGLVTRLEIRYGHLAELEILKRFRFTGNKSADFVVNFRTNKRVRVYFTFRVDPQSCETVFLLQMKGESVLISAADHHARVGFDSVGQSAQCFDHRTPESRHVQQHRLVVDDVGS